MAKRMIWVMILFLCFMIPQGSTAHNNFSSSSFIGEDDVIDNGGAFATSTSFGQLSAIGQSGQGTITSSSFILNAGFLHPIIPSPTPTATITPTTTLTSTITPTSTPSMTASSTPTFTETPIVSATPTSTVTCTETATPEHTVTVTPTITLSATITVTSTVSETATPTATATMTPTVTPTLTISATSTITTTATPSPTQTMTPTRSNWEGEDAIYYPQPCQIGTPSWFQVVIHESQETAIAISIYNSDGERVAKMNARGQTGLNKIAFDNGDLAPGIYYYIVQLDGKRSTHKMVLVE